MEVISINKNHYPDIAEIYRQGIDTGMATFETSVPSWESWNENKLEHSRLIAFENNEALGWVALSKGLYDRAYSYWFGKMYRYGSCMERPGKRES